VKGHYVSVGAQGMYVGTGIYKPEPATLRQLRAAMAADVSGRKLQSIVTALRRKGYTVPRTRRRRRRRADTRPITRASSC
jgi:uncharacterized protein (DUF2461 family)